MNTSESPPLKKFKVEEQDDDVAGDADSVAPSEQKFVGDLVDVAEVEKLREFQVLDEVNEEDTEPENSDSSEDLAEEEIDRLLEEKLPEEQRGAPKPKEKPYVTSQKIVLEEKGVNQFEVLPLDWMLVRHYSGMPVYLHKATRVCTLSRPYFLGKGSARRHDVPLSAIPCLSYRRALEEEEKQKEIDRIITEQIASGKAGHKAENKAQTKPAEAGHASDKQNWIMANGDMRCKKRKSLKQKINGDITKKVSDKSIMTSNDNKQPKADDEPLKIATQVNGFIESTKETKCPFMKEATRTAEIEENVSEQSNKEHNIEINTSIKVEMEDVCEQVEMNEDESFSTEIVNGADATTLHTEKCPFDKQMTEMESRCDQERALATEAAPMVNGIDDAHEEVTETEDASKKDKAPAGPRAVLLPDGEMMIPPRVETVANDWKSQHLTYTQLNTYCSKLFRFKTINIMNFKRWTDRRRYAKARKTMQYPVLPKGTKLITIPNTDNGAGGSRNPKRDWVMNMNGCSYLSVFHEYVRLALHKQPTYHFQQLENASLPYQATVYIGGMQYGVGRGSSKRQAKAAAAKASIHILIPEMKDDSPPDSSEPDLSFFECIGIEDPRVAQFCQACAEPSPHAILRTCLSRNFGATDRHIRTEVTKLEYQKIELTMRVGKHTATVVCKNKKTAKQRASQAILQKLHPHVRSWGSLLRLYGAHSVKTCKEKKMEEQQITLLQDHATQNQPNLAVLSKLRTEMLHLKSRDGAVVPIGTLLLPNTTLPTHSGANLNNVQL